MESATIDMALGNPDVVFLQVSRRSRCTSSTWQSRRSCGRRRSVSTTGLAGQSTVDTINAPGGRMRLRAYGPIFVALVVLSPAAAMAQRLKPADRGPWEITAFGGSYDDSPEYRAETFIDPNYNLLFGAGLRYHLSQGFFLSAEGRYAGLTMRRLAGGVTDLNSILVRRPAGVHAPAARSSGPVRAGRRRGCPLERSGCRRIRNRPRLPVRRGNPDLPDGPHRSGR